MKYKKLCVIASLAVATGPCDIPNYVVSSSLIICITDVLNNHIVLCVVWSVKYVTARQSRVSGSCTIAA
jgi:hypothetical protein